MRAIYKTPNELQKKIAEYFDSTDKPSIMEMRLFLKISKQMLTNWKNGRQDLWELYEIAQTTILAQLEKKMMYENLERGQVISYLFLLRSYERDTFSELAPQHEVTQQQAPMIVIDMPKYKKGEQPNAKKATNTVHTGKQSSNRTKKTNR